MKFSERMQTLIGKGIAASKEVAARASEQAQTWGEMGVLRIEIIQLRSQEEKLTTKLGAEVYAEFVEESQSAVYADAPAIKNILVSIHETEKAIVEKEAAYRRLGGRESELEG
jgi:hypothetical protein